MADISSCTVRNFACVFPDSLLPVAVEHLENAGVFSGLDIVLVRRPDKFVVFLPGNVHPLASSVHALEGERFAESETCVFQLSDEAGGL